MQKLHLLPPTRQARLRAWMKAHGVSAKDLQRVLGLRSLSGVYQIMRGELAPPERIAALAQAGVPEDLLPPPSCGRSGPRAKEASASA